MVTFDTTGTRNRSFRPRSASDESEAWGRAAGGWQFGGRRQSEPLPLDHPVHRWRAGTANKQTPSRWFVLAVGGSIVVAVAVVFVILVVFGPL